MYTKWIKFFSFWIVFSLIFSALNLATKLENKRWRDFHALPPDSIDVLFLGNSHNYATFQPEIIDDIVPVHSYVLGIGAESIILTYYELREVLRYQHPKLVVLETYVMNLADKYMPIQNYFDFLDSGTWDSEKSAVAALYLKPESAYAIFPALRTRVDIRKPYLYLDQFAEEMKYRFSPTIDPGLGADPIKRVISDPEYQIAMIKNADMFSPPTPEVIGYLDKIVQLCRENGIQLVLTHAPEVNWSQSDAGNFAVFDAEGYAKENGLPFVQFDRSLLSHLHFSDYGHVNVFGSTIVSILMAQRIADLLNVAIDQEKLAYYQGFVFYDYSTASDMGHYQITLYPRNSEANLEYNWSVTDLSSNQAVTSSGWQKGFNYQFTLNAAGEYGITVEIRNSSGSYEINAAFPPLQKE